MSLEERGVSPYTYVATPLEKPQKSHDQHDDAGACVIWQRAPRAHDEEVADRLAALPARDIGSETIIGEAPCRVQQRVFGKCEVDVELLGGRTGCWVCDFVGMV